MKLIAVNRVLEVYRRSDDELVSEIPLNLSLAQLKEIVTLEPADDYELYWPYKLTFEQVEKLITLAEISLNLDFKLCSYVLECHGIYE
ncbi:DUF7683 domain-containing protein [Arachidicoccus terrestris]|uniref:DUF7683 domain-containing protein n=1 Tax=Arachidicoccus terrestris TaxID=2875539 RepID=UPI001CC4CD71|nr:hypothetical protein [Arachidicoccus terrestris]UAY55986.1 hypothetical protein K9M52_02850 [Arachidicoccus terrestris]